jgi:hypothetical protein
VACASCLVKDFFTFCLFIFALISLLSRFLKNSSAGGGFRNFELLTLIFEFTNRPKIVCTIIPPSRRFAGEISNFSEIFLSFRTELRIPIKQDLCEHRKASHSEGEATAIRRKNKSKKMQLNKKGCKQSLTAFSVHLLENNSI